MSGIEFDQGEWTFGPAEDYGAALRAHCGDADDELSIAVTELLIAIVMAAQYGHRWTGCVVCALIDNDNAKCWLRTRVADNRYVRYLLQILAVLEFKFKFRIISYYVNTKMNFLTDYIGRDVEMNRSDRIELLQKPLIGVFVPGMVYREMDSLLLYFTSGHTVLSTYELPDDGPGSLAQVLGRFPEEPPSPAESVASDKGGGYDVPDEQILALIGFVEVCAGIGVMSAALEALGITLLGWIERDPFEMRYLRLVFSFALWCRDIMGGAWRSWSWAGRVPLILVGGPPCVFASLLGR